MPGENLHYPVDRCTTMNFGRGFLCNCGRTIVGGNRVQDHFGKPREELEEELNARREPAQAEEA